MKPGLFIPLVMALSFLLSGVADLNAQQLSRSFELRYFSSDERANGETDFKGETEIFDTAQRIEYLKNWAAYGKRFFWDATLSTRVVAREEVISAMQKLKPQPQPSVRTSIPLEGWKYLGYKAGQRARQQRQLEQWTRRPGVSIEKEALVLSGGTSYSRSFPPQSWRMAMSWSVKSPEKPQQATFRLSEGLQVGMREEGTFFYVQNGELVSAGSYQPDRVYNLNVELDLESGRYNFYVDGELLADFVPLAGPSDSVHTFRVEPSAPLVLDNLRGTGYTIKERESRTHPYLIHTFLDQEFALDPSPEGFQNPGYDDGDWPVVPYRRYAHGGERHKGETLFLRKKIAVGDFQRAILNIETVRPSAEMYINGKLVQKVGRHPEQINVSDFLYPGRENLIAVKVHPYEVGQVQYHMSTDKWAGWFAGLMELELTHANHIKDVFAYTLPAGHPASVRLQIKTGANGQEAFTGRLVTRMYPWYPEESGQVAAEFSQAVRLEPGSGQTWSQQIPVPDPEWWTADHPHLYKIRVELQDEQGTPIDDYVMTTGLRTISQEGGTFRINGQPEMMNGPLVFNQPYPLERVSKWMFSPPKSRWVETILMVKKMNGNAIRMSVHDKRFAGVNDRRLAQIGDQMGMMFMWQTPAWIRTDEPDRFDFEGLPKYTAALRNHPSIIMWQVGNHPTFHMDWFENVYNTLYAVDPSRLIAPTADVARMTGDFRHPRSTSGNAHDLDDTYPSWRARMVARGNMEQTLGYGRPWSKIRKFPERFEEKPHEAIPTEIRKSYLNSSTHAFFDYESEETIAQPNWSAMKGKPYYHLYSYEKDYDIGSIGRVLNFDEWQQSQAWQALSVYEAYRKKRWLDYDGLNWCPLQGGPNTATYKKPVVDYHGHAKLGFYAMQMVFQDVLAGSHNVDIALGPGDAIEPVVLNLGDAKEVVVIVEVKDIAGRMVGSKQYTATLPAGRTVTTLAPWNYHPGSEGFYAVEYQVINKNAFGD